MLCSKCKYYDQNAVVDSIGWCFKKHENTSFDWKCADYALISAQEILKYPLSVILQTICDVFKVEKSVVVSSARTQKISDIRHAYYYLARQYTKHTLAKIGNFVNRKDHSTVRHGFQQMVHLIKYEKFYQIKIDECIKLLEQ